VAGTWNIDGIQVERKVAAATKPGAWTPPSSTEIYGGMMKTGSIQSTALNKVWDTTTNTYIAGAIPSWSIDMQGDAVFGNVQIKGNLFVGDPADLAHSYKYVMASAGYVPNSTGSGRGWMMHGDGWVEFNQVVANTMDGSAITTGTLAADSISGGRLGADVAVIGGGGFSIFGATQDPDVDTAIIQLNPTVGLVIDPPGIGSITVPSDGNPIEITDVSLSTSDATFNGNIRILGTNNIIAGDMTIQNSVQDPTELPTVTTGWVDPSTYVKVPVMPSGYYTYGLCEDTTGSYWVTTFLNASTKNMYLAKINKTTGAYTLLTLLLDSVASGGGGYGVGIDTSAGVGKISVGGVTYYVILYHAQATQFSSAYWMVTYVRASDNKEMWVVNGAPSDMGWQYVGGLTSPSIFSDGTYVYIGGSSISPANNRYVARYAYNGTGFTYVANSTTASTQGGGGGLYIGAADWGTTQYVLCNYNNGAMQVFPGPGSTNDTTKTFNNPNGEQMTGILWDGTQFRRINAYGKVYKHSTYTGTTASHDVTYAWYDSDPNPTTDPIPAANGTHRTKASPIKSYTFEKRGWVKVTTPRIPDSGNNNDPDSVIIYIDDWEQAGLSVGVNTALYGTFATSGTHSVATSEFASFATNPGRVISAANDLTLGTPLIELKGDGSGRLGPWNWDATGELPAISCYKTGSQSIPGGTSAVVAFDNVRNATGGMVLSGGMVKVPRSGWYQVNGNVTFASSTSSTQRIVGVCLSTTAGTVGAVQTGTMFTYTQTTFSGSPTAAVVWANAGNYLGLWANAGVSFALSVSQTYMNHLSVAYIGG
jgi:hypothetical protein